MKLRECGFLVSVLGVFLGFGSAAHAQWTDSFTDLGVSYTFSDLTIGSSTIHSYSLVLNTTGYTGPSSAFLDSVNIKAWDGTDISFSLTSAPPGSAWAPTEGSISSGTVGNTGCGGTGSGFACVEAVSKGVLSVGPTYTFGFDVTAASAESFISSAFGYHVGAGYADSTGRGASFGITSYNVAAIPEPEIYAMLLAGLGLMGFVARRRRQGSAA